ncbi:hypothetical protein QG025_07920 [Kingella kingae]|uniref:hypothetical protein n=1 Tax=Kingella kingae TaxID=504 RepID=UPI002556A410|nr:hypothetical protein [Kingella kingae]MDK4581088.1 hypothetical protein [Kingella kingae]
MRGIYIAHNQQMCSSAWLKPVLPACSSMLPTLYHSWVDDWGAVVFFNNHV